jgi:Zn-dependent protease with chaperone function
MEKKEIKISKNYTSHTIKAILSIVIFAIIYLLILAISIFLTFVFIYLGIEIIDLNPTFITLFFGIGIASMGVFVLIFMLKFLFKSYKFDYSQMVEINEKEEPHLFKLIKEIAIEVGTSLPKKVFITAEVNASVFYDSSFWSMFFPVKKNLVIGLGLVNSITKEELKAILCHEFGHFSQKSMKVGSYVYNVNKIFYNLLYDNESYDKLIEKWTNLSGIFSLFVLISSKMNKTIQNSLKIIYEKVNINYMALSREMEFHADAIAASITGYEPLKKSLLRMTIADVSYNNVLNFYNNRISKNIKSESIYKDQSKVIQFIAETNQFPLTYNLPDVSLEEQSKFNKSKLYIEDQWSSHPSVEDRIIRLENTGFISQTMSDSPANELFADIDKLQKKLTDKLFDTVTYLEEVKTISSDAFINDYKHEALENSFDKRYNGYYDNKNPILIDLENEITPSINFNYNELFSDKEVDKVYTAIALSNDIQILDNIYVGNIKIKTFDYDGEKYHFSRSKDLIKKLNKELELYIEEIKKNDFAIFNYFNYLEQTKNKPSKLKKMYLDYFEFDKEFDSKYDIYNTISRDISFINETTSNYKIIHNFEDLVPLEAYLKTEIKILLTDSVIKNELTPEVKTDLYKYTSTTLDYFDGTSYLNENLAILYTALNQYSILLSRKYFLVKKALLNYQIELLDNK